MPLRWNEIRARSITFSREWADASRERAEAQTFWNEFFDVFGKSRRAVASFEEPVKKLKGDTGYIDLIWPGHVIAEHKSRGKDLGKAQTQALGYVRDLVSDGRETEAPQYILVSDFARLALHNLEEKDPAKATVEFPLSALYEHIRRFAFLAGYETRELDPEDPANIKAAALLANLHDRLEDSGYTGHDLQRFMVRILFCLFADDTGIFEPDAFRRYIESRTREDGSDLGPQLARLFDVLNTPTDQRQKNLDEDLAELPYVNGLLFAEHLRFADFNAEMRRALLTCCGFRWQTISPAVFGSLFQSIMQPRERRQIGAHYTSERDILKLIRSLFLDRLRERLNKFRHNKSELKKLLQHLGSLRFLDPACGCGNFLVLGYRELRRLEMDALQALYGEHPTEGELRASAQLSVDQFHGIEIEEWPSLIAEVAMWLMDHQMNNELFARFGTATATVPLKKSPHIVSENALRIDWNTVLPAKECSYIMGNPPFVGSKFLNKSQREEMAEVWEGVKGGGQLDYVTAWYGKASDYLRANGGRAALVSTNSITQGEQVGVLWPELFRRGFKIDFGHRTFPWESEARGKAHVHVVIVGFGHGEPNGPKLIHDYGPKGEPLGVATVSNVSPYLTEGSDTAITNRSKPLCQVPFIIYGSMQNDGGHLLMSQDERNELIRQSPNAASMIRPLLGSEDLINGKTRWCLWLVDTDPQEIRSLPAVMDRIESVRQHRLKSSRPQTRELAKVPYLFGEIRQPKTDYLAIPRTSSERRRYIPLAFLSTKSIANTDIQLIPDATHYHFGVLHSSMHMAWVRQVCGRLKSDYRYSAKLVYNNYPWPDPVTDGQRSAVESAAQGVLDARLAHPGSTLADLYDPLTMPADLARAHAALDRAVDRCYRPQPFPDERRRFEYLFGLYEKLVAPLVSSGNRKAGRGRGGGA